MNPGTIVLNWPSLALNSNNIILTIISYERINEHVKSAQLITKLECHYNETNCLLIDPTKDKFEISFD